MDPIRRKILAAGAAATAMAAAPRVFAQQTGQGGAGSFYERGPVRIHYEEFGSGFPLLLIAGGGLNSTISALIRGPFNPIVESLIGEPHMENLTAQTATSLNKRVLISHSSGSNGASCGYQRIRETFANFFPGPPDWRSDSWLQRPLDGDGPSLRQVRAGGFSFWCLFSGLD